MATLRTGQISDFGSQTDDSTTSKNDFYSIASKGLNSPSEKEESYWTPEFDKWHGWYRNTPELRSVIDKLASWTFGRGIKADKKNKAKLNKIKGNGNESARLVLKNIWRCAIICGDGFGHIIKDKQGRMTNLKQLNPGNVKIVYDNKGIIIGYELLNHDKRYNPEEIYHLSYERIGNEMHGIPFVESLQELICSRNEALDDLRILYHRNIKPIKFFEVETDDTTKLNSVEATINEAYKKSENVIISTGVIKEIKESTTPQYSNLDSLSYIKFLVRIYISACGIPEVVMGWGENTTEASSNIIYLSFQQEIEDKQLYNQEMAELQLGIEFNLEFPASLEQKLQENEEKRGKGTTTQPNKDG